MAPNAVTYCLQELSDYDTFEALCHDLMVLEGYGKLEPLGGRQDKGRDAIHVDSNKQTTIFAYSAREDWRAKLSEDASKVFRHGHNFQELVFITTSYVSAGQRDEAIELIRKEFGWELSIYSLDRLRLLLENSHSHLIARYPQIFPPDFFSALASHYRAQQPNLITVCCASRDAQFGLWLSDRMRSEGYCVWCRHDPEAEPQADSATPFPIPAACVLIVLSRTSARDETSQVERNHAHSLRAQKRVSHVIPLRLDRVQACDLDPQTARQPWLCFDNSWATGLNELLQALKSFRILSSQHKWKRFTRSFLLPGTTIIDRPDTWWSNLLVPLEITDHIMLLEYDKDIKLPEDPQAYLFWPFRKISDRRFLSFTLPPDNIIQQPVLHTHELTWRDKDSIEGISTRNLIAELLKKSLIAHALSIGMHLCPATWVLYFPSGMLPNDRVNFDLPTGRRSFVNISGERTYKSYKKKEKYRYQLAVQFFVAQHLDKEPVVIIKPRVRITDGAGQTLEKRAAQSRRKHLCKNWWNDEWANRVIAIIAALSNGKNPWTIGTPEIGVVTFPLHPFALIAPFSIDPKALPTALSESLELDPLEEVTENGAE